MRDAGTTTSRNQIIFNNGLQQAVKATKENCMFFGIIFGLAAQLGDTSPQPQTIKLKATQNIVKIHFSP